MSEELEKRFYQFAMDVRNLCAIAGKEWINHEYVKQLLRSSASVGANYIEASDLLGKADENMKLKIARREAKESVFWLQLLFIHTDTVLWLLSETAWRTNAFNLLKSYPPSCSNEANPQFFS